MQIVLRSTAVLVYSAPVEIEFSKMENLVVSWRREEVAGKWANLNLNGYGGRRMTMFQFGGRGSLFQLSIDFHL